MSTPVEGPSQSERSPLPDVPIGRLAQNLRAPLSEFVGHAGRLQSSDYRGDQRQALDAMMVAGSRLTSMIEGVLDEARGVCRETTEMIAPFAVHDPGVMAGPGPVASEAGGFRPPSGAGHRADTAADDAEEDESDVAGHRRALGEWLDIDPQTLEETPSRSLALALGIDEGEAAGAVVEIQRGELHTLQEAADTDYLTGIPNRRAIERRLRQEWRRVRRYRRALAVLVIDIDGLKAVNDGHGHEAGDSLIVGVAQRLAVAVRGEDSLGRVGGDEFLVVCPEADESSSALVARKLAAAVSGAPFEVAGALMPARVSIGWASMSSTQESPRALIAAADARLYEIKRGHCTMRGGARAREP